MSPGRPRRAAESSRSPRRPSPATAYRGSHPRTRRVLRRRRSSPACSILALSAGASGRLTQHPRSIARTMTPTRPPGFVARTSSASISLGVAFLERPLQHSAARRTRRQRQASPRPSQKSIRSSEPFAPRRSTSLAAGVGARSTPVRAFAPPVRRASSRMITPAPAPDLEHPARRVGSPARRQFAHDADVAGPAPFLEARDAAEMGGRRRDRAPALPTRTGISDRPLRRGPDRAATAPAADPRRGPGRRCRRSRLRAPSSFAPPPAGR